jgi:hypothetical protein
VLPPRRRRPVALGIAGDLTRSPGRHDTRVTKHWEGNIAATLPSRSATQLPA